MKKILRFLVLLIVMLIFVHKLGEYYVQRTGRSLVFVNLLKSNGKVSYSKFFCWLLAGEIKNGYDVEFKGGSNLFLMVWPK